MGDSRAEPAAAAPTAGRPSTGAISPRAAALHDEALVWDMVFVWEPDHGNDSRLFPRWRVRRRARHPRRQLAAGVRRSVEGAALTAL